MFATSLALISNSFRGRDRGTALGLGSIQPVVINILEVIADAARLRHNSSRLFIPGSRCSQGGV